MINSNLFIFLSHLYDLQCFQPNDMQLNIKKLFSYGDKTRFQDEIFTNISPAQYQWLYQYERTFLTDSYLEVKTLAKLHNPFFSIATQCLPFVAPFPSFNFSIDKTSQVGDIGDFI